MGELLCEIMRPEADMPLDAKGIFLGPFPSGAPAIFIDTAARLGCTAGIIGGVGRDDFGRCIVDRLKADGVDCRFVQPLDGATGVAFVTYFRDGSRRFLFHFADTPATRAKAPTADIFGADAAFFHICGCSLMASTAFGAEILSVMDRLAGRGVRVSFDPNIRPELMSGNAEAIGRVMAAAHVLLPGEAELLAITSCTDIESAIRQCFESPNLELLALKRGGRGCTVYTRYSRTDLGVYLIEPVDPTGAGDCFDAALLCGLLSGKSPVEAARLASAAAALNTMAFGPMEGDISPASVATVMASATMTEGDA